MRQQHGYRDRLLREADLIRIEYRKYVGQTDDVGRYVTARLHDRYQEIGRLLESTVPLEAARPSVYGKPLSKLGNISTGFQRRHLRIIFICLGLVITASALAGNCGGEVNSPTRSQTYSSENDIFAEKHAENANVKDSNSPQSVSRDEMYNPVVPILAREAGVSNEEMRGALNRELDRIGMREWARGGF